MPNGACLYLAEARGIYLPQNFFQEVYPECIKGVSDWARLTCLKGPEAEGYWEAWDDVLRNGCVETREGVRFTLYQDGDFWLIPEGAEWGDEQDR